MHKLTARLSICFILGFSTLTFSNYTIGKAAAFTGTPLVQCTDDYSVKDPFRVINTVEADTSKPGFMLLKFDSAQGVYPFEGIVTVNWHNLSSNETGHFQEQRLNNRYTIAAVPSGPGTIALSVRFNNTLSGGYYRVLPTAQCNATLEVISTQAATTAIPTPSQPIIANPIAVSATTPAQTNAASIPAITPLAAVKPLPVALQPHSMGTKPLPAIIPLPLTPPPLVAQPSASLSLPAVSPIISNSMQQSPVTPQQTPVWSAPIPVGSSI